MGGMKGFLGCAAVLMLAGCAAAPVEPVATRVPNSPLITSSGLVIGTLSYQYVDASEKSPGKAWVVHFERIDTPARQDYALAVDVDPQRHSGVFTGALPAGVYAFREAAADDRRFVSGVLRMPFEVQAGEVRDAGHYAVNRRR